MSFWERIDDQQQGNQCEIYRFNRTGYVNYYTSYHEDVQDEWGTNYVAKTLKRSPISSEWHAREVTCTLTGTTDENGAFAFLLDTVPDNKVEVRIWRLLLNSPNVVQLVFFGRMQNYTVKKSQATVRFEGYSYLTHTKVPRIRVQSYCNHRLFDDHCGLSKVAYRIGGTVVDTSGDPSVLSNQLVLQGSYNDDFGESFLDKSEGYFTAGVIFRNGHYRYISKSEDYAIGGLQKKVTIQEAFPSNVATVGNQFDLWPGCDKSPSVCTDTFDNFDHFLGFPYVPSDQQSGDVTIIE